MAVDVTLVFPANHPDGMEYIAAARERGEKTIAASSQWDADAGLDIGEIVELPYVNDPQFLQVFDKLVLQHKISRVYAPAVAVFTWLKKQIEEQRLQIQLVGWSPIAREAQRVRKILGVASRYESFVDICSDCRSVLSKLEVAAAFRMSGQIFGESNSDKIAAMLAILLLHPRAT
ncbi:hypothetical protein HZ993_12140 [Rhodoferax sp. AJA081-3]|uniref:hypothetical protein n=1 Tax=Rhodoferax sp. AJA081-3 TaxID=2752316 RepID=UPI001ADF12CC|nr:hypothetical protein [Rhodoferax sp. AJA081-3]QTN30435.1 hypothetical protein HZ993_12140 [Rhodoferax sp. AJA081-3]